MARKIKGKQIIEKLNPSKGGYAFLQISPDIVDQFKEKKKARIICTIDSKLSIQCGFNSLGNGSFFIIISSKNLKVLGKQAGEEVSFELTEDPNPLGVTIPETIEVLLAQDAELNALFESFTPGRKRSIIHLVSKIKDMDKQIQTFRQNTLSGRSPQHRGSKLN